jgi:hypothetical protein
MLTCRLSFSTGEFQRLTARIRQLYWIQLQKDEVSNIKPDQKNNPYRVSADRG